MGKNLDKLGSLDSFRAPWETEGGSDAEIDKPKLKRWIYGVLGDKAKAQDARDDVQEKLATAEKDLETAKAEAADANGEEAQKKIDKLEKKVADLTAERDGLVSAKEQAELREEVLGDFAVKNPKAAKYVKGETREELEKSLEEIKADFGITDGGDEDDEEEEPTIRTKPRVLGNPADPDAGKGAENYDFDKVADEVLTGGRVFG